MTESFFVSILILCDGKQRLSLLALRLFFNEKSFIFEKFFTGAVQK